MLPACIFSKTIKTRRISLLQWFNVTLRLSSNSPSDFDSKHKNKYQSKYEKTIKHKDKEDDQFCSVTSTLLRNKWEKRQKMNVSINLKPEKSQWEAKLYKAAETLTSTFGGDKESILSSLMKGLPTNKSDNTSKDQNNRHIKWNTDKNNKRIYEENQIQNKQSIQYQLRYENKFKMKNRNITWNTSSIKREATLDNKYEMKDTQNYKRHPEKSVNELVQHSESSVIYSLLKDSKVKQKREWIAEDIPRIFTNVNETTANVPKMEMWNKLQMRETKQMVPEYPRNAFQQMIQWTQEGKLWKFPIDNEQGMEEEHNVHFSEHVFLERHLVGWCPTKGPVRHFMELVCVGLSKNPYMTVQEKYDHIMWYKQYFESKKDILEKLGVMETVSSNTKEQIELQ